MSFTKTNGSFDPYEGIYFQDFLKNGLPKRINIKGISFIILCHLGIIGLGIGCYRIVGNNILHSFSLKFSDSEATSSVESIETYSLVISQDSVALNLDEDETTTIDVSANNTEKSFKVNCDYSDVVSVETVSNNDGIIAYKITPQSIGTGYLEYKLTDSNNESIIYDTKRINVTVKGTLSTGTFNNHSYRVFDTSMTWTEAKAACEEIGGHLATISSNEEQDYVQQLIKSTKKENIWIGGCFSAANNSWSWVDNTEWNYTNWDVTQPDNYTGDEFYLRIKNRDRVYDTWEAYDGKWNDTADSADGSGDNYDVPISSFGYVCEWDYISSPVVKGLEKSSSSTGFNGSSDAQDCFGNSYSSDSTFTMTLSGPNQSYVIFYFDDVEYRSLDFDFSISQSTKEKFKNTTDYSFDSNFMICDAEVFFINSRGTKDRCYDSIPTICFSFFDDSGAIHKHISIPEGTKGIMFGASSLQKYASVNVIFANLRLSTEVNE